MLMLTFRVSVHPSIAVDFRAREPRVLLCAVPGMDVADGSGDAGRLPAPFLCRTSVDVRTNGYPEAYRSSLITKRISNF